MDFGISQPSNKDILLEVIFIKIKGIFFVSLVMLQHVGGVIAFLGNKNNPIHRAFGRPLATIGRIVATFGWIVVGNMDMAKYVALSAAIILIGHLLLKKKAVNPEKTEKKGPKR